MRGLCWRSRPRLYWITWDLQDKDLDVTIDGDRNTLTGHHLWSDSVEAGWTKVDATQSFPTFTTARPRATRGHRPADIEACDGKTII